MRFAIVLLTLLLLGGCGDGFREVDHPFYLYQWEDGYIDLIRCPSGPGKGCAVDGLPERVLAAGANQHFIVAQSTAGYFYFSRVPEELRGWGNNPERIVGPLSAAEFNSVKVKLQLPDFTVRS